jgi:hemerythrin
MTIVWRSSMAIGDATVDADHQKLIELINAVESALLAAGGRADLAAILDQLAAYTKEHFDREESLMRQIRYGELEQHREAHRNLRLQFGKIRTSVEAAKAESLPAEESQPLVVLLRHWLLDHVFKEDMKLKAFLKRSG